MSEQDELIEGVKLSALIERVMDALIPPGHDVYDTRTHVAVPVETIREAADSLQKIASGSITGNNHAHRPWAQKRADALRSLLPTESAGDDDAN